MSAALAAGVVSAGCADRAASSAAVWGDIGAPRPRGFERIILIYGSGGMPAWSAERLGYYVSHVGTDGVPDDWFFDSVLFLALAAGSLRGFDPGYGTEPSRAEDWRWYLDERLFGGYRELAALEEAVRRAAEKLKDKSHLVRVIIMVPFPDPRRTDFGSLDGRELDFSRTEDRGAAVGWYLREVARRWSASRFGHLRLGGFYWLREEVSEGDRDLLKLVRKLVGKQFLPLYWIPYFNAPGKEQWRELGFDIAIQQPNYYFYEVPPEQVKDASQSAQGYRMGMELELDRRVLTQQEQRDRYYTYLRGGATHRYEHAAVLAWYDDTALLECGKSKDPEVRRIYDDTHAFVRGTYRPE